MSQQKGSLITIGMIVVALVLVWGAATFSGQISQAIGAPIAEATHVREVHSKVNVYPISSRKAALIALRVMPSASSVEDSSLVSFQGTAAYEVQLDSGIVYVDAISGQVVYTGKESPAQESTPATLDD